MSITTEGCWLTNKFPILQSMQLHRKDALDQSKLSDQISEFDIQMEYIELPCSKAERALQTVLTQKKENHSAPFCKDLEALLKDIFIGVTAATYLICIPLTMVPSLATAAVLAHGIFTCLIIGWMIGFLVDVMTYNRPVAVPQSETA